MIKIISPGNYPAERTYILSVIFSDIFGLDIQLEFDNRKDVLITNGDPRKLYLKDNLFQIPKDLWLKPDSLPKQPLKVWDLGNTPFSANGVTNFIPVIYGKDPVEPRFCTITEDEISLGLDIFGSAFFMLTRYEEKVKRDRDAHERFPAAASLAFQEGFLERPIINEYLEILWTCLKKLWPSLQRKKRLFQIHASHDVDRSYFAKNLGLTYWAKRIVGDVIIRHKPFLAAKTLGKGVLAKLHYHHKDLFDSYDWLMDQNEKKDIKCSFYFICGKSDKSTDANYSINESSIRRLIHHIYERGHEIGLHPSYNTFHFPAQLQEEASNLRKVMNEEGIKQELIGGRQHYLRWQAPTTWQLWEDNGLAYDSTLGYSDNVGFRCGICYEYPVFNLETSKQLNLRERPLIIMDVALLENGLKGPQHEAGLKKALLLKERTRKYQGVFEILWHNYWFCNDDIEFSFYKEIIA